MPLTATEQLVSWASLDHNTTNSKSYLDAIKWIAQGADLNACAASYEGEPNHVRDTALIWAARRGDEEMVRFFFNLRREG